MVKTRLGRTIGDARAAALYRAFLTDIATRFRHAARGYDLLWAVAPMTADWHALVGAADGYVAQEGPDWTERQRHIFTATAARGYNRTILIASDSPQLPARTVAAAFAALETHGAVLTPTFDGGYSLIGQRAGVDILGTVRMSTSSVFDDLRDNARTHGIAFHALPPTWDVDEVSDLVYLAACLAGPHDLPATAAAFRTLDLAALAPIGPPVGGNAARTMAQAGGGGR
jgi:glycosyltransferase A (GT-A) superfamily protein (DUF2064 family)